MPTPKRKRWFKPGRSLGWKAEDGQRRRRELALKSRRGNPLKAGRALLALSNITKDKPTKSRAKSDALFFFALNRKLKDKK